MALRLGHFGAMEQVLGYLRKHYNDKIVIDPQKAPVRGKATFNLGHNWVKFYPDACKDVAPHMPDPKGEMATLTYFIEADHVRDKVTCRSVTGIVLLLKITQLCGFLSNKNS